MHNDLYEVLEATRGQLTKTLYFGNPFKIVIVFPTESNIKG